MRDNLSSGALTETSLLVLLSLYNELHGYGIKKFIENNTNGRVVLGMGTLYGAINNLEKKGWIEKRSKDGNRINYIITDLGIEQVNNEKVRLKSLLNLIDKLDEGDYEKD
ncbi:MAG: PadR family transcriptional regulator [Tissierellia bacterium]|nr:PadR family transcriptional regulator [Tissierellia bacterium]